MYLDDSRGDKRGIVKPTSWWCQIQSGGNVIMETWVSTGEIVDKLIKYRFTLGPGVFGNILLRILAGKDVDIHTTTGIIQYKCRKRG